MKKDKNEEIAQNKPGFFALLMDLPTALTNLVVRYILMSCLFAFLGIAMAIHFHAYQLLVLLLLSAWALTRILTVVYGWHNGKILEQAVVCVSSEWNALQKKTSVIFRSAGEQDPDYYSFVVPEHNRKSAFVIGRIYTIYTHVNTPDILIAWLAFGHFE